MQLFLHKMQRTKCGLAVLLLLAFSVVEAAPIDLGCAGVSHMCGEWGPAQWLNCGLTAYVVSFLLRCHVPGLTAKKKDSVISAPLGPVLDQVLELGGTTPHWLATTASVAAVFSCTPFSANFTWNAQKNMAKFLYSKTNEKVLGSTVFDDGSYYDVIHQADGEHVSFFQATSTVGMYAGETVLFTYNENNLLSALNFPSENTSYVIEYSYVPKALKTQPAVISKLRMGNVVETTNYTYAISGNGSITQVNTWFSQKGAKPQITTFNIEYDDMLVSRVSGPEEDLIFEYDSGSRLMSVTNDPPSDWYTDIAYSAELLYLGLVEEDESESYLVRYSNIRD